MVLVVHSGGLYAERVIAYLSTRGPVAARQLPRDLPMIIDDPEEYFPPDLGGDAAAPGPSVVIAINLHQDLLLEIPHRVKDTARALIAPREDASWVKPGLQRQLAQACAGYGIETAFPKPFCALDPEASTPAIRAFCEAYGVGLPRFRFTVENGLIAAVEVLQAAPCSLTAFLAEKLVGLPADETLPERAGYLHHAYPCLATMTLDPETGDTVMHQSLAIVRKSAEEAVARSADAGEQQGE